MGELDHRTMLTASLHKPSLGPVGHEVVVLVGRAGGVARFGVFFSVLELQVVLSTQRWHQLPIVWARSSPPAHQPFLPPPAAKVQPRQHQSTHGNRALGLAECLVLGLLIEDGLDN